MPEGQGSRIPIGGTRGWGGRASRHVEEPLSWPPSPPSPWYSDCRGGRSPSFPGRCPSPPSILPIVIPTVICGTDSRTEVGRRREDRTGLAGTFLKASSCTTPADASAHDWTRYNRGGALPNGSGCRLPRRWRIHAGTCVRPCMLGRRLRSRSRCTYWSRLVPDPEVSSIAGVDSISWALLVCHVSCTR